MSSRRGRHDTGRRAVLRGLLAGGLAAGLTGCGGASVGVVDSRLSPEALAQRYIRLALELARHQPSLLDVWLGADTSVAGPRRPVATIRAETSALVADLTLVAGAAIAAGAVHAATAPAATPPTTGATRLRYLLGQARALDTAAARLQGESFSFAEQAQRMFGHEAPRRDGAALDRLRQQLSEALPGAGALAGRHAAYRRAAAVPRDRVETVFRAAVDWCRQTAAAHLPLPAGEALTTRGEDTGGWAAFSRPTGPRTSELWVATGGGADAAHLLQLAAHEGTPGHHAQHVLAAAALVDGLGWTERELHPAFGPHRLYAEGAAEAGTALLLPEDVRVRVCREILLPAGGQSPDLAAPLVRIERLAAALDLEVAYIAADYLDTPLSVEGATARLRDEALVLDPPGMLGFIEKQRTNILAYPLGRRLVTNAIGDGSPEEQWVRLAAIATTLTLPATPEG